MTLSLKAKNYLNSLGEDYDPGIAKTYLFALYHDYPTHYFPFQLDFPKTQIVKETLDKAWVKQWVAKWPKQSETGLPYSISGNFQQCLKRFQTYFTQDRPFMSDENRFELIDRATDAYIERLRNRGFEYAKKNLKFIYDEHGSTLEGEIEKLFSEPEKKRLL